MATPRKATLLALMMSIIVSGLQVVLPAYARSGRTLYEVNGPSVFFWTAVPVLISAIAYVAARLEATAGLKVAAVLMAAFAFITGFSIGLWHMPSAIVLLITAFVEEQ